MLLRLAHVMVWMAIAAAPLAAPPSLDAQAGPVEAPARGRLGRGPEFAAQPAQRDAAPAQALLPMTLALARAIPPVRPTRPPDSPTPPVTLTPFPGAPPTPTAAWADLEHPELRHELTAIDTTYMTGSRDLPGLPDVDALENAYFVPGSERAVVAGESFGMRGTLGVDDRDGAVSQTGMLAEIRFSLPSRSTIALGLRAADHSWVVGQSGRWQYQFPSSAPRADFEWRYDALSGVAHILVVADGRRHVNAMLLHPPCPRCYHGQPGLVRADVMVMPGTTHELRLDHLQASAEAEALALRPLVQAAGLPLWHSFPLAPLDSGGSLTLRRHATGQDISCDDTYAFGREPHVMRALADGFGKAHGLAMMLSTCIQRRAPQEIADLGDSAAQRAAFLQAIDTTYRDAPTDSRIVVLDRILDDLGDHRTADWDRVFARAGQDYIEEALRRAAQLATDRLVWIRDGDTYCARDNSFGDCSNRYPPLYPRAAGFVTMLHTYSSFAGAHDVRFGVVLQYPLPPEEASLSRWPDRATELRKLVGQLRRNPAVDTIVLAPAIGGPPHLVANVVMLAIELDVELQLPAGIFADPALIELLAEQLGRPVGLSGSEAQ